MNETDGATLKVKVAVKPEVTLGDYAGLSVTKKVHTVKGQRRGRRAGPHAGPQRPSADP